MKKSQIILISIVLVLVAAGSGAYWWFASQVGTVGVNVSSSPKDLSIRFNGERVATTSKSGTLRTYRLHKDDYLLKVTAAGYKDFSIRIPVETGDNYRVAVNLELLHDSTITSPSQVEGLGSGVNISNITYYQGQTWAVITLSLNNSDPAYAAIQYDPSTAVWHMRAGPGTYFSPARIADLPQDVATDLMGRGL